ncbi:hypothetical protein PVAP13_1NG046900 [Panicum virgatum]|uniref:Cathepsin propeptide inhibitor domain-containing protein n=1 Tax=Panicum virgatum TaxID=38727 RepID=A0A8T0WTU7_PANVG|nr:hypothetical protein PVAP13_1NG046900 [Panicum virgatum]
MWALYHRWCKHFKMERDHDEMVRRFAEFKNCVLHVHQVNRAGLSYKLAINKSADTSIEEKRKVLVSLRGGEVASGRLKAVGCLLTTE